MSDQVFGEDYEDGDDLEYRRSSGGLSGKKLLILVAIILAIIIAIGAALFFSGAIDDLLAGDKSGPEKELMHQAAERTNQSGSSSETPEGDIAPADVYVTLPDMLVNLQPDGRRQHFMKIRIALELHSDKDKVLVEKRIPRVMDKLQDGLRGQSKAALQGSAGYDNLKTQLKKRANVALETVEVKDVLIQELLVQ